MASIYDKQILDAEDLEKLEKINLAWQTASDSKTKNQLHDAAEAIRGSYGYSGGADGSEFIIKSAEALSSASAFADYAAALEKAAQAEQDYYNDSLQRADAEGEARLREAYVKNMQDSLGIGQKLKSAGITGGAGESTLAYMNNIYNSSRNDIISDVADSKREIQRNAASAASDAELKLAQTKKESAAERADIIKEAENTAYEREKDARDFEYQKAVDDREFEFKKTTDQRDFDNQKAQDEKQLELDKQKAAASASKSSSSSSSKSADESLSVANVIALIKAGAYSEKFADILGISDSEVKKMSDSFSEAENRAAAWELLEKGIYDDSFPELLGYDEDTLINYANSRILGY